MYLARLTTRRSSACSSAGLRSTPFLLAQTLVVCCPRSAGCSAPPCAGEARPGCALDQQGRGQLDAARPLPRPSSKTYPSSRRTRSLSSGYADVSSCVWQDQGIAASLRPLCDVAQLSRDHYNDNEPDASGDGGGFGRRVISSLAPRRKRFSAHRRRSSTPPNGRHPSLGPS
jgi:hypothetical protein